MSGRAGGGSRPAMAVLAALGALGALAYGVLTCWYLRPPWRVLGGHIAHDVYDPVFNLYLLQWVAHKVPQGLHRFWDAPFFYPARHVITYSDHLLGPGLATAALGALGVPPLAAYDGLLLASYALCGLTTFYVLERGGASGAAAFAGGCVYAFSPFRWDQISHLQVLLMQWIPLTLWSWDRLLERVTWRRAGVFLVCYLLHISGGNYLAYMIHLPLLVLLLNRLPGLGEQVGGKPAVRASGRRQAITVLAAAAVVAAAGLVLIYGPYWRAAQEETLTWGRTYLQDWGASVLSYLTPSPLNLYSGLWPEALIRPENALFPGWVASALAAVALVALWRRYRNPFTPADWRRRRLLAALLALGIAGWLSGEFHTWARKLSALEWLALGHGYRLPAGMLFAGLGGWLALRRSWSGGWPLRFAGTGRGAATDMRWRRGLLLATLAAAVLSTPLGFYAASALLPGMRAMRVPARFDAFVSFGVAFLAARGLDLLLARLTTRVRRTAAATLVIVVACVELAPRPMPWPEIPDEGHFPPVYGWLARQPDVRALLEVPTSGTWVPSPELAAISYMHYGTLHWKPLVNGYSARFPVRYRLFANNCCWPVPGRESLAELRGWGVTHLVIHLDRLPDWQLATLRRWEQEGAAPRVYADPSTRVYRLLPGAAGGR
jgi:hypothetical protein